MKVEILTDDIGNYDRELENRILNGVKELGARLVTKEETDCYCDAIADISTIEDLIKYVKLHPYKEVSVFIEDDGTLNIAYCDIRDDWEIRQYGMTEEEKAEEKEMFKALDGSEITFINDEGDDYYCYTDAGVSFIPTALQWDYA